MFLKNYKNLKKLSFYEFLILLFPFCILSGSFVTNLYLIFVSIFLIRNFYKKKETILIFKKALTTPPWALKCLRTFRQVPVKCFTNALGDEF